jgi:cytochrome c biogenesis protein CcmG/thiol:disulfide interchange protein DsbE
LHRILACSALVASLAASALHPATLRAEEQAAPSFALRTVDGRTVRLSEFRGRPVILDFWATWCAPCRASMPHLNTLQSRYRDQGLVVLGLSVDDTDPQVVRRYADRLGVTFRIAVADEKILDLYGPIRAIPTTFFINRRGDIVRRVVGYIDQETMDGYARELF